MKMRREYKSALVRFMDAIHPWDIEKNYHLFWTVIFALTPVVFILGVMGIPLFFDVNPETGRHRVATPYGIMLTAFFVLSAIWIVTLIVNVVTRLSESDWWYKDV